MLKKGFILFFFCFSQLVFAKTTILTLNIANYNDHPHWETRVDLIVDAILQAKADIVVLQEVRFSPDEALTKVSYQNAAEQILQRLNEKGAFQNAMIATQPAMYFPGPNYPLPKDTSHNQQVWEGLSVISKSKLLETGSIFLSKSPQCVDNNLRITQYVKIAPEGKPIYIFNTHFGLQGPCLVENMHETIQYMQQFPQEAEVLLMGDFNALPSDGIFSELANAGKFDAWSLLRSKESGFTFPANAPNRRIDFIWVNAAVKQKLVNRAQIWRVGDAPKGSIYPSDHLGLALSF